MSNMAENGSGKSAWPSPSSESHEEFLELCALATTELLSAQERGRLEDHLRHCASCREMHAQYQSLVGAGIPVASVSPDGEYPVRSTPDWSIEAAEAALFARLDREQVKTVRLTEGRTPVQNPASGPTRVAGGPPNPRDEPDNALWRQVWWQYAAGILLVVALGYSFYRIGIHKGVEIAGASAQSARLTASNSADEKEPSPAVAVPALSQADDQQVTALRSQLESEAVEVARLEAEKTSLEKNLHASQTGLDQLRENLLDVNHQLAASQADLETTKRNLEAAGVQNSQRTVEVAGLRSQIDQLTHSLEQRDTEFAREQELLDHDEDIRELMGSRNLYIAEVYDVAKNGNTQRPFGRVFYTKGKSLIFYAYDLDQQPGLHGANAFQAWGRRGTDQANAVNLGILYVDNAAKKRWVLKDDDPKTLTDIDAVFVTVEPDGGSNHPSGKPLLFAYLRVEPNHP
jgi:hypothetical protein